MSITVPHHRAEQTNENKENQTPQRDLLATRDVFGEAGLRLREGKENSEYILQLLMDAFATPEFGKLYFGELRADPAIQEKFWKIRSPKEAHNDLQRTKEITQIIEHLLKTHEADFKKNILSWLAPLQQRLESFKENKKKEQQPAKQKIKEATKSQMDNIAKFKKVLKWLDETVNKATCETYRQKITLLENEITEITNKIKNEDDSNPSTLAQRIETTKKEIQQLTDISTWKDVSSERYEELKKQYLITKWFLQQAERQLAHTMYTKEEAAMQTKLFQWIQKQQTTYKLSAQYPEKTKSLGYYNAVAWSKEMLLTIMDLKEHFISIITELLQIKLIEEKIKKLYPQYDIRIFKAPLIDDLKANTDCFIAVKWKSLKEDLYFAVDLKTSSNGDYLSKELKSEKRAHAIAKKITKQTLITQVGPDILHTMIVSYLDMAVQWNTHPIWLGEHLESVLKDWEKRRDKNRRTITKENLYAIINDMQPWVLQAMVALFLQKIIDWKKDNFDLKLLGPTLQKALEENIMNFWRSAPLYGTAHLLDIPATQIKNFIMEISPSITYTIFHQLLQQAHVWSTALDKNYLDATVYEKIHRTVTREEKTTIQKISYHEQNEILKNELEKLLRNAA
jgi:hypothetical protein